MVRAALVAVVVLAFAGCGHNVGDDCHNNVDCSPSGDRFCDTAAPNGYCTIDGCDFNTCPSEAVCIRFFTQVLDQPCDFNPSLPFSRSNCPHVDDRCVCDVSKNGVCQGNIAHCAPESSERRWCQLMCSSDSDCRVGYECRATGTLGAESVPTLTNATGSPAKFCAPKG